MEAEHQNQERAKAMLLIKEVRFEHLDEFFDDFKPEHTSDTSVKFRIERKKFFFGSAEPFNEGTQR